MLRRIVLVIILVLWPASSLSAAKSAAEPPKPAPAAKSFALPEGNPTAGRVVFLKLQCNHCHMVSGTQAKRISMPVTALPAPLLNSDVAKEDPAYLVTAIIAPSHTFAKGTEVAKEGKLSPMGDYTRAMSVRELIDLVAFLQSLEETPMPVKAKK